MKAKKTVFAVFVIIIVLAFSVSIFGSGITAFLGTPEPTEAPAAETNTAAPESSEADDDAPSPFIQSIQRSMTLSEDASENAAKIAMVINVYNTLYDDKKIINLDGIVSESAIQKLIDANIYFSDISPEQEAAAWVLVTVDSEGVAASK